MEIKGTSAKNVIEFIRKGHADKITEFIENLPEGSKELMSNPIFISNWYDVRESYLYPIETVGKLYFDGDSKKAANEIGKFGALKSLKGIYKIFIKNTSLDFAMSRATSIFDTYYKPGKIEVERFKDGNIVVTLFGFIEEEALIFEAIKGWFDGLLSIIVKGNYSMEVKSKYVDDKFMGYLHINFL